MSTQLSVPDDPRIEKALSKLHTLLVPGEEILAWAVQRRWYAMFSRRQLVVATSGRCIWLERKFFGGFTMHDLRWQDLKDARIDEGTFSSSLIMNGKENWQIGGLRKTQAESVYRIGQTQEQSWREKNRVRSMEELRAKSGGVQLGGAAAALGLGSGDPTQRLARAKQMREQGLISDAEFEEIKAKILEAL